MTVFQPVYHAVFYDGRKMNSPSIPVIPVLFTLPNFTSGWDDYIDIDNITFEECVAWCDEVRTNRGTQWDGMAYKKRFDRKCICFKNDRGQDTSQSRFEHFRWE